MSDLVGVRCVNGIAIATIDNPPVNALSQGVRKGLLEAVDSLEGNETLTALVIACAGKTFIAGADIKEFGRPLADPQLAQLIARIEQASKPVIAAIHGKALGGGLEVALGCHYRIAVPDASIGLPEVTLGIIPGAGGTQRLPRLIGLAAALTMISEGSEITAAKSIELGAIDFLVRGDLQVGALAFAEQVVAERRGVRRTRDLPMPAYDESIFTEASAALSRKRRGYEASLKSLDAVRLGYALPFDAALSEEYAICKQLLNGRQSRALRHNFAAERTVRQIPGLPEHLTERSVAKAAVIGLGRMGSGIAMVFANAGIPVVGVGRRQESLDKAMSGIADAYAGLVKRGSLSPEKAKERIALITPAVDYGTFGDVDLVVEAVGEDMEEKRVVFVGLGAATRRGTILATNTSYLDIDALATASGRPEDVCGMHFFNPAPVMRLLENVRTARTAPDVLATITQLAKRIGKLPVLSGVCDGFIVNRMLSKRSRECYFMLEEGASPARIDHVLTDFGFPMGPFALADLAGIDVQYAARKARWYRLTEREKAANFVDQLYERHRYGQKTGAGWYRYGEDRKARHDAETDTLLAEHSASRGITRRLIDDQEILDRCLYAMVNEGAKILEERIAARPEDIDVAMINGLGFPAYAGGPMWWAGEMGLRRVRDAMLRYCDRVGSEYWMPSAVIQRLADSHKTFYDAQL